MGSFGKILSKKITLHKAKRGQFFEASDPSSFLPQDDFDAIGILSLQRICPWLRMSF